MTTTTNKATANTNVKGKPVSKAEQARKLSARLAAKGKADAAKVTLDEARAKCITKTGESASSARVYAHALIAKFGADYYTFTAANARTDNERAHFAAIEDERKLCAATYASKYGEEGKNMPWSRAKAIARQLREGGEPRQGKPLDVKQKTGLLAIYRAGMKEERQTEQEANVNEEIGRLLVAYFKVDLSQHG